MTTTAPQPEKSSTRDVNIVLASGSPRRREIIKALATPVGMASPHGDEGMPYFGEKPREYVLRLSLDKARQASQQATHPVVIGADTAVVLNGQVLGKPADHEEATEMLQRLRGQMHTVVTGVTVLDSQSGRSLSGVKSTDVWMRDYSDGEIAAYVASGEPLDKAGGYAIQDEGFRPADSIQGCYLNVVGFPLCEVIKLLDDIGVHAGIRHDWQMPEQCQDCPLKEMREDIRP